MADSQEFNHMSVVEHGELERITHSGHVAARPGSKVCHSQANTASTTSSRFQSSIATALELLTPEEIMEQEYDLELEDYDISESQDSDDGETSTMMFTGRTSSLFGIPEPPGDRTRNQQVMAVESVEDEEYMATRQIALFPDDDTDSDIGSEEERDIIKEIKYEITNQVRGEMKGELANMKRQQEKESKKIDDPNADLQDLEPELRAAFIKMRKLDKVLAKKMKREKEVKRDRILLQKRLKGELENLKPEGKELKEARINTEKFLALTLPPSHNEGVYINESGEPATPPPVTPVFQTQVPMDEAKSGNAESRTQKTPADQSDGGVSSSMSSSTQGGSTASSKARRRQKKKDFIKRNINLASDAANAIAMTDDEKQRLDNLLNNLESLPELPEEMDEASQSSNPYQIVLSTGEGFCPAQDEIKRLEVIDNRLRNLLPPEDFQSIASSSPRNITPSQSVLFTRTHLHSSCSDVEALGEQALKETKEHRAMQSRLKEIEDQLNHLTSTVEFEIASPSLSEDQLNDLLDMCARTISRTTAETESITQTTARSTVRDGESRATLLENAPRLPDDVLQQLLADARQSGIESATQQDGDTSGTEPVSHDTIRTLLQNSRATSRVASRTPSEQFAIISASESHIPDQTDAIVCENRPRTSEMVSSPVSSRFEPRHRQPFLPQIDPKGSLTTSLATAAVSTQKPNNLRFNVGSNSPVGRMSAVTVRNQFADSLDTSASYDIEIDQPAQFPRPPSSRRSQDSRLSSRMKSPYMQSPLGSKDSSSLN